MAKISGMTAGVTLAVCTVTCSAALAEQGVTADRVVLGQSAAVTGVLADAVKEMNSGAQAYFEYVNAQGGVHGRRIVMETLDDGFDPKRTVENTKKFISDGKTFALFFYRGTSTAEAAIPLAEQAKIPFVAPFTGASSMRTPVRRYVFPLRASIHAECDKIIEQLTTVGMTKIGVLAVEDGYGDDALDGVQKAMATRNIKPVVVARLPRNSMKFEAAVAEIVKTNPQALVVLAAGKTTSAIIRDIRSAGQSPQFFVLSNNSTASFVKALGEDSPGVGVAQVTPYPFSPTSSVVKEFLQVTKGRPDVALSYTSLEGFIAAKVVTEGLRRAGRDLTRERFVAAMETLKAWDVGGTQLNYGPGIRTGLTYVELTVIGHNGKFFR